MEELRLYCLALCFVLMFFSPISTAITTYVEERAFVCFARVDLCPFPFLLLGDRKWVRLLIVALPGLFFVPFCFHSECIHSI